MRTAHSSYTIGISRSELAPKSKPLEWLNYYLEKRTIFGLGAHSYSNLAEISKSWIELFSHQKEKIFTETANEKYHFSAVENQPEDEKPLRSRERNNLLKVIAALCREQNLSLDMPFKAAGIVENQIKSLGLSLGNDTIALILSDAEKLIKSVKIS
jgi:galactose mutarotase-like enzyme